MDTIVLGGGCFWCLEAVFDRVAGVSSVTSGYAGGHVVSPTYEQVCTGRTGHAEVGRIEFDPGELPLRDLLRLFFATHDPTTKDRQGADTGPQYRSIILYDSDGQRAIAEGMVAELEQEDVFGAPIVTEIVPLETFYPAEDHHQDYFLDNPNQPYCQAVIAPKVAKLRSEFADRLKAERV